RGPARGRGRRAPRFPPRRRAVRSVPAPVAGGSGSLGQAPTRRRPPDPPGMRAGFLFLWREPVLRGMTLAFVVFAVSVGSILVAELPLSTAFGVGALGYGLLSTSFDFGALFGALAGKRVTECTERAWLVGGSSVRAAGLA